MDCFGIHFSKAQGPNCPDMTILSAKGTFHEFDLYLSHWSFTPADKGFYMEIYDSFHAFSAGFLFLPGVPGFIRL